MPLTNYTSSAVVHYLTLQQNVSSIHNAINMIGT